MIFICKHKLHINAEFVDFDAALSHAASSRHLTKIVNFFLPSCFTENSKRHTELDKLKSFLKKNYLLNILLELHI